MNPATLDAFHDELEKIALGLPGASTFVQNVGRRIVNSKTLGATRTFLRSPMKELGHGADMLFRNPAAPTGRLVHTADGVVPEMGKRKVSPIARNEKGGVDTLGTVGRAAFAYGTYASGKSALKKGEDPNQPGRSRPERVGRFVGGTALGLGTMRALGTGASGIIPGIALGMAGESIGGAIGKAVGKAKAKRQQRKDTTGVVQGPVHAGPSGVTT